MESDVGCTRDLRLVIARTEPAPATLLARLGRWIATRLRHADAVALFDAPWEADDAFARAVRRAFEVQRSGYDLRLAFLPRYPDAPPMHLCTGRIGSGETTAAGHDFRSRALAAEKAISETLERHLWGSVDYWSKASIWADHASISQSIDPRTIAGFSEGQKRMNARLRVDEHSRLLWTRGVNVSDGKPTYVPTQLVSERHALMIARDGSEPILRIPSSNGLATHRSFDTAAATAMLELIERDAFMIAYHNQIVAPRINPASIRDDELRARFDEFARYGFELDCMVLPTDMPVHVACCALRDRSGIGPALSIGARARTDINDAISGALAEAYSAWIAGRANDLVHMPSGARPWGIIERLAFWSKVENLEHASWMWAGSYAPSPESMPTLSYEALARAMRARGCAAIAVPMSPPLLRAAGIHSVCVCSPELQPLNLGSDPEYRGGARLAAIPEMFGYDASAEPPAYPHPFP